MLGRGSFNAFLQGWSMQQSNWQILASFFNIRHLSRVYQRESNGSSQPMISMDHVKFNMLSYVGGEGNRTWKIIVTESEHTFSKATQLIVSLVVGIVGLLIQWFLLSIHQDGGASFENSFRSSLHDQEVSWVRLILRLVDGYLWKRKEE